MVKVKEAGTTGKVVMEERQGSSRTAAGKAEEAKARVRTAKAKERKAVREATGKAEARVKEGREAMKAKQEATGGKATCHAKTLPTQESAQEKEIASGHMLHCASVSELQQRR